MTLNINLTASDRGVTSLVDDRNTSRVPTGPAAASANKTEESQRLVDMYRQWFDVIPARTPELVRESHKLRYQVYCLETGFEDRNEFPEEYEHDQYDERSVCSLLIHKPTDMVAGTVRLILPKEGDEDDLPAFHVSEALQTLSPGELPKKRTAEISRFAISKQFRKRAEDSLIPALYEKAGQPGEQRVIPHITLGLMQAILSMSIENKVSHLAIVVEPALDRLIRKLGIFFTPIGQIIEYHGRRRAHYRGIGPLLDEVYYLKPEIWEVLTDSGALWPPPNADDFRQVSHS